MSDPGPGDPSVSSTPALEVLVEAGLDHRVVRFAPAGSLAEAARRRGVTVDRVVKTMVVRRAEDDYLFVLVPGDRAIDWARLRRHLDISRLTMAGADEAQRITGYARGTITPLGSRRPLPVVADRLIPDLGEVSLGGGAPGVAVHLDGRLLVEYLGADLGDVTKPG